MTEEQSVTHPKSTAKPPKVLAVVSIQIPDATAGGERTIAPGDEVPDTLPDRTIAALIRQGAAHREGEEPHPLAWTQETPV